MKRGTLVALACNRRVRGEVVHYFDKDKLVMVHWRCTYPLAKKMMPKDELVVLVSPAE